MPKRASKIAMIGIDIGKNSFHVVGLDWRGVILLRQKWSRGQIEARLANMPSCLIGMEACVGAHHLARNLTALGHDARLLPAKYVRPEGAEERLRRCRGDCGSRATANDKVRRQQIGRSTRSTSAASRSRAAGLTTYRHHQSDPSVHSGTGYRRAVGHPLSARRTADHPGFAYPHSPAIACWRSQHNLAHHLASCIETR
jgi:hypothetical protein